MEQTEINTHQLRQLLEKYEEELAGSFLERRGRSQLHKDNAVDELRDVIRELMNREKELQAIVGIAKMLLTNNEILSTQTDELIGKKLVKSQKIKFLKLDLETLKQDFKKSQKRYEDVSGLLIKAEEELLEFNIENKRLRQELSKAPKENCIEKYQEELEEVRFRYEEKLKQMQKSIVESSKNSKTLQEKLIVIENEYSKKSDQNLKINKDIETYKKKVKDLEGNLRDFETSDKDKDELLSKTTNNYNKAMKKIKDLEEEISMMQNAPIAEIFYEKPSTDSLMNELAELEDAYTSFSDQRSDHRRLNSVISEPLGSVAISSKKHLQSKDPCEEFFILATQSVKMNSPFMDAICKVPTHVLYRKAVGLDIPMHKWYEWIEDELNSVYIQMLYQDQ